MTLLNLYMECMKHNISITIKTLLSDASIEVRGDCLAYRKFEGAYEHLTYSRWIPIEVMRTLEIDTLRHTVNDIFHELLKRKEQIENE